MKNFNAITMDAFFVVLSEAPIISMRESAETDSQRCFAPLNMTAEENT